MPTTQDNIALITGGTSGIGRACARRFARRGYDLLLTFRKNEEKARALQSALEAEHGVRVVTVGGDLVREEVFEAVFEAREKQLGGRPVELLLHCAGLYLEGSMGQRLAGAMNMQTYDYYQALYPKCFVQLVERVLPDMPDHKGRILSLSSAGSSLVHRPRPGYDLPAQAKASLEVIARYYAVHLLPRGITCNLVLPGVTDTDGWAGVGLNRAGLEQFVKDRPLPVVLEPEDIAASIDFLMSDQARYITGVNLSVDAGGHLL